MSANPRTQGHNFERIIVNQLRELVPEAQKSKWLSARQGSREEDNKGNDIVNQINIRFQCKKKLSKDSRLDITPLFTLPKEDYFADILFIKSTKKNKTKEPATANELTSIPIILSISSPTNKNIIMMIIAAIVAFSD